MTEVGKLQSRGEVDTCTHQEGDRERSPDQCSCLRPERTHAIFPPQATLPEVGRIKQVPVYSFTGEGMTLDKSSFKFLAKAMVTMG